MSLKLRHSAPSDRRSILGQHACLRLPPSARLSSGRGGAACARCVGSRLQASHLSCPCSNTSAGLLPSCVDGHPCRLVTDSVADGPTQYLLGALVLKLETSCCTRDLPHLGHFGGRFFKRSCSLIGTLTSKCLPHALHSNS